MCLLITIVLSFILISSRARPPQSHSAQTFSVLLKFFLDDPVVLHLGMCPINLCINVDQRISTRILVVNACEQ